MIGNIVFTNVRILDGSGAQPFAGEVRVQGNRIARVARETRAFPAGGATVIEQPLGPARSRQDARRDEGRRVLQGAPVPVGAHPVVSVGGVVRVEA